MLPIRSCGRESVTEVIVRSVASIGTSWGKCESCQEKGGIESGCTDICVLGCPRVLHLPEFSFNISEEEIVLTVERSMVETWVIRMMISGSDHEDSTAENDDGTESHVALRKVGRIGSTGAKDGVWFASSNVRDCALRMRLVRSHIEWAVKWAAFVGGHLEPYALTRMRT